MIIAKCNALKKIEAPRTRKNGESEDKSKLKLKVDFHSPRISPNL